MVLPGLNPDSGTVTTHKVNPVRMILPPTWLSLKMKYDLHISQIKYYYKRFITGWHIYKIFSGFYNEVK